MSAKPNTAAITSILQSANKVVDASELSSAHESQEAGEDSCMAEQPLQGHRVNP